MHYRIMCDDGAKSLGSICRWRKTTDLLITGLATSSTSSKSVFGNKDPAYADRWNNVWRTRSHAVARLHQAWRCVRLGLSAKYLENIGGIVISAISTAAVNIWIDRIYSPDWPCAVVTPIFDGWYSTARDLVKNNSCREGGGRRFGKYGGVRRHLSTFVDLKENVGSLIRCVSVTATN